MGNSLASQTSSKEKLNDLKRWEKDEKAKKCSGDFRSRSNVFFFLFFFNDRNNLGFPFTRIHVPYILEYQIPDRGDCKDQDERYGRQVYSRVRKSAYSLKPPHPHLSV